METGKWKLENGNWKMENRKKSHEAEVSNSLFPFSIFDFLVSNSVGA